MEEDPVQKVLADEFLLGEIIHRSRSSLAYIRSSAVNRIWYTAAKTPDILDLFLRRNTQSFLGFVIEYKSFLGREVHLIRPQYLGPNPTLQAMEYGMDYASFTSLKVLSCNGSLVLYSVEESGELQVGYYAKCPFAQESGRRYVGPILPKIPVSDLHNTANFFGQYGILMRTGKDEYSPFAFFTKEAKTPLPPSYAGVRFNPEEPVYVHVSLFSNGRWDKFVSDPLAPPDLAAFHRNPYCILGNNRLFMMYLVGYIVCFEVEQKTFTVIQLPTDLPTSVHSWFDYTVAAGSNGGLILAHFTEGYLNIWGLQVEPDGMIWELDYSFNLVTAFGAMLQNMFPDAQLIDVAVAWGSVQVRSASQGGRYVLISVGLNAGLFIADMIQQTLIQVPNVMHSAAIGRVFKLEENWPPKI